MVDVENNGLDRMEAMIDAIAGLGALYWAAENRNRISELSQREDLNDEVKDALATLAMEAMLYIATKDISILADGIAADAVIVIRRELGDGDFDQFDENPPVVEPEILQ